MGRFVNPNNSAFQVALNSKIYIDKTGLLAYTNSVLNTDQAMICNSRPRRFGKSITANMLVAYYSRTCDSEKMFENLQIAQDESFRKQLNQHDVIYFDVQWCMAPAKGANNVVSYLEQNILAELRESYPGLLPTNITVLAEALAFINEKTGRKFIVIIDEWDVLIRDEALNHAVQTEYIEFLRGLFKGAEATKYISLAYLTGILPIKKLKTQSALNNFDEFTMLAPDNFAPYIGFTEAEVRKLCEQYGKSFEDVTRWYDGYLLGEEHVYNPKAVVSYMLRGIFRSYWSQTGTYESIVPLLNMNFDGLKTAILTMLSGEPYRVKTKSYQNDMVTFKNKDDVLTVLIHLGYLAYNQQTQEAYIPNEEIRSELLDAVEENNWNEFIELQRLSESIVEATLAKDAEAVAEKIGLLHMEYASAIQYNDENSLSSVLSLAYLSAMKYYFKPLRELPLGRGFADLVFIPRAEYTKKVPALLIELKWNHDAETAIRQIKEKQYPVTLKNYVNDVLLVGINYDKKSKKHSCVIEEC